MSQSQSPGLMGRLPRSIRSRLTLWFVIATVGAVLPGAAVVYFSGLENLRDNLGQNFCSIAERSARNFEGKLLEEFQFIQEVSNDSLTIEVMQERQKLYRDLAPTLRLGMDNPEFPETKKVADIHPELSFRLRVFRRLHSRAMTHLSLYDRGGNLVADSDRENALGRDKQKWHGKIDRYKEHFRYLQINDAGTELVLVTPIWEGIEIIGYALGDYDFQAFDEHILQISAARFGETGRTLMINADGKLLNEKMFDGSRFSIPGDILEAIPKVRNTAPVISMPFLMPNTEAEVSLWDQVACIAPLGLVNKLLLRFGSPGWGLVVTQSPGESYDTLFASIRDIIIAGFFGALLAALVGITMAWRITAPLKKLERGVQRFASGERDVRVSVVEGDEVGDLARAFNLMARHVTESEQEIRAFAMAVENSADAIIMTNRQGVIYYTNPAFEKVTGYSNEEAVGNRSSIMRVSTTPKETYKKLWGAVAEKKSWRGELWNKRKNGNIYPVELTVSPVLDEHNEIVSILGIHRDITLAQEYRESLEREVEERSRQIIETEGLTAVGRMAGMIAHDLRNALSTVKMNMQILSRHHNNPENVEYDYCRIGLGQVRYMEEFLSEILNYTRPSSVQCDWYDINELVDEVLSAVSLYAGESNVELSFDENMDLPMAMCDRSKIVAVLRNLIDNAVHAIADGGNVRVTTEVLDADDPETAIVVSVRDDGIGISDEDLEEIFDPFFTMRTKGTGLGLTIAKKTIEQHGGEITVTSKLGEGTTISFSLPHQQLKNGTDECLACS